MARGTDLGGGVWVFQTRLWQTNAVLAISGTDALLVDPGFEPSEIEELAARAREPGGDVHVLVTHGDYDHTCGVGYLNDAIVLAGAETAERIRSGTAGRELAAAGAEWGFDWPPDLRVDRVIAPGEHALGPFRVTAIAADGHTADGLAYVLLDQGVLVPGDYVSDMTYPFVVDDAARAIATYERLLEALEHYAVRWVVPGHGRPLSVTEARAVAEADLEYLQRLSRAADEAQERGLSPGYALLHVFDVAPPRATTPDFEVFGIHAWNARAVIAGG